MKISPKMALLLFVVKFLFSCFSVSADDSIFSHSYLKRAISERDRGRSVDVSCPGSPTLSASAPAHTTITCNTTALLLALHAGSVLGNFSIVSFLLIDFIIISFHIKILYFNLVN